MTTSLELIQDPTSVYYIDPSDTTAMKLSPFLFDGERYGHWKRFVMIALSAKNKFCFVDGTLAKPVATDPSFRAWERCNSLVIGWLMSSVSPSIGNSVMFFGTAREMWVDLEESYGQVSSARLFSLHQELHWLEQTTENIAEFFTKVKSVWDELDSINPLPVCECGGCTCSLTSKILKMQQNQRLLLFLMKLKDEYKTVRTNILMMQDLPGISQAYRMLVQEEILWELSGHKVQNDSIALAAERKRDSDQTGFKAYRTPNQRSNFPERSGNGHTKERRYKLHGYSKTNQY